jgi:hypothetical protein
MIVRWATVPPIPQTNTHPIKPAVQKTISAKELLVMRISSFSGVLLYLKMCYFRSSKTTYEKKYIMMDTMQYRRVSDETM